MKMKRIVICVVCYNQEDVIARTLDSILCQKEWGLYRLIVSDDCSTDHTWQILQQYKKSYPEILDIHRNEHNLGIYGNVAQSNTYLPHDYDLICDLAGDDSLCDGYFEALQKFISDYAIDTLQAVGIYSDWKAIFPDGRETIFSQAIASSGLNLWSLKIRGKVCGRSLMTTKAVRDQYEPVLVGKGLSLTETHYDSQPHLHIKKAYYLPIVASIYYKGIGVSTQLDDYESNYHTIQAAETWNYCLDFMAESEYDKNYLVYMILRIDFFNNPSLRTFFKMLHHYNKGQIPGYKDSFKYSFRLFARNMYHLFVH